MQSAQDGVADRRQSKVMRHHHENGDPSDEIELGVALFKVGSGGKEHAETDLLRKPDAAQPRGAAGYADLSSVFPGFAN